MLLLLLLLLVLILLPLLLITLPLLLFLLPPLSGVGHAAKLLQGEAPVAILYL